MEEEEEEGVEEEEEGVEEEGEQRLRITQFLSHSILIISGADRLSAEAKCRYSKTDGRRAAVGVLVRVKGCGRAGVDQSGNSSLSDTHRSRPPRHLGPAPSLSLIHISEPTRRA